MIFTCKRHGEYKAPCEDVCPECTRSRSQGGIDIANFNPEGNRLLATVLQEQRLNILESRVAALESGSTFDADFPPRDHAVAISHELRSKLETMFRDELAAERVAKYDLQRVVADLQKRVAKLTRRPATKPTKKRTRKK